VEIRRERMCFETPPWVVLRERDARLSAASG